MGFPGSPANNRQRRATVSTPKATSRNDHGIFMNLPSHIIAEILARLPVRTIIHCKSVCRQWYALITHPYFPQLHFANSRSGLVIHHSELFRKFFRMVDLHGAYDPHQDRLPDYTMLKFDPSNVSVFPDADIVVDGSIDGLLLLRDINYNHEMLYICNPVTRECVTLPQPDRAVRYPSVVTHGFGVAADTREYKVVRVFHKRVLDPRTRSCLRIPFSECQVYTLGSGAWRCVGEAPFGYDSRCMGLFFQGNVHWLVEDLTGHELISCFDLQKEAFKPFPGPFPGRRILGSLGILQGCLCLCDNSSDFEIHIWVMRQYGVQKSWSNAIVIKKMAELVGPSFHVVSALRILSDGKVLLMWGDFFMFCYCRKTNVITPIDLDQPVGPNSIEAMNYVPTFQSLTKFVKKENVCVF